MGLFLTLMSGICWTVVYIELIRRGFKDKTYGMPLFALGLNIAWEVLYSIDGLFINQKFIPAQSVANVVWALCDVIILITYFKYGKKYFPQNAKKYFVSFSILAIATCVVFQLAFYLQFENVVAASQYSAFAQNAAMSIMFLIMLFNRNSVEGQSLTIAICKCLGTLAPTILGGFIESINIYIILTGSISFVFDIIYIIFLIKFRKSNSQSR